MCALRKSSFCAKSVPDPACKRLDRYKGHLAARGQACAARLDLKLPI